MGPCPTCGATACRPWVRVRFVPWRVYEGFATDNGVGTWADVATKHYSHFRCTDPCHGPPPVVESLPEGTTVEGYERVTAFLQEIGDVLTDEITPEKIQRGMELARSYGLGTVRVADDGDVYFDMNDEAKIILRQAFEDGPTDG